MAMVTKALKRKEIELGFINLPKKDRSALIGEVTESVETKLNGLPAKIDKQGRLWCTELLKNKFQLDSTVTILKNGTGFELSVTEDPDCLKVEQDAQSPSIMKKDKGRKKLSSTTRNNLTRGCQIFAGDCIKYLNNKMIENIDVTFFDPPYLQGKEYRFFDDKQSEEQYWNWIKAIVNGVYQCTNEGGAIYFMHREKNAETILRLLKDTGWNYQNLIVWKKKTSAVPIENRFSKQYQIIVYAIKGAKPRIFNKVRIDPPPLPEHKYKHENGIYLTDVWDDIRELTSGYFAGEEALRDKEGNRMHVQQTPVALLLRIILSSTMPGDTIFDPTAGSGTALVVAKQLDRNAIGIEIDPTHVQLISNRISRIRAADSIASYYNYYRFTPDLDKIWYSEMHSKQQKLT